jgi:hypothetical protein
MRTQELLWYGSQIPNHGPTLAAFLTASRERALSGNELTIVNDGGGPSWVTSADR